MMTRFHDSGLLRKLIISFAIFFASCGYGNNKELPSLTVFIHGTLMPYLALSSWSWITKGEAAEDSYYHTAIKKLRTNPLTYENYPMLQEGFIPISRNKILAARQGKLSREDSRCAIYYFVSAYDAVSRACNLVKPNHEYVSFGWFGKNSLTARREAAEALGNSLAPIAKNYKEIEIIAYSHGANVALEMYNLGFHTKRGLKIDRLVMLAVPIQVETAGAIASDMFKTMVLIRSEGDNVPQWDMFTTSAGQSFAKMSSLANLSRIQTNPGLRRLDVSLVVNNNRLIVNHNNIYMFGDKKLIHESFGDLPAAIVAPIIIQQLAHSHRDMVSADAHIVGDQATVYVHLMSESGMHKPKKATPINFYSVIREQRDLVKKYWRPILDRAINSAKRAFGKFVEDLHTEDSHDGTFKKEL